MESLENQNNTLEEDILTGELITPVHREHLFSSHEALCKFAMTFGISNYNVRYGQTPSGKFVYQLVYQVQEN